MFTLPKLPGPRFWTVRTGQSFGSVAAHTGINITKLEALNPKLKPTTLSSSQWCPRPRRNDPEGRPANCVQVPR